MATPAQIAGARRFAPPLFVVRSVDRRGAKIREVNRQAVAYAKRAGLRMEDVFPGSGEEVRKLAPARGTKEAEAFLRASGLGRAFVYPEPVAKFGDAQERTSNIKPFPGQAQAAE